MSYLPTEKDDYLLHQMCRIQVAIDPGVKTGFVTYDKLDHRLLSVQTVMIHTAMFAIIDLVKSYPQNVFVHFEDARQRKWFGTNEDAEDKKMGAGSIRRDCKIWEDFLTSLEIPFRMVPPQKGMTKWSEEYFKKVTKWEGRTSNHSRDACALVFGK